MGGGEDEGEIGGKKNRPRMKADTEQHQLKTTAAGEADRPQRERRETMVEEGNDRTNPHWRNGGVGKKLKRALLRLADKEKQWDKEWRKGT